jgi:hypothetical protein
MAGRIDPLTATTGNWQGRGLPRQPDERTGLKNGVRAIAASFAQFGDNLGYWE